MKQYEYNSYEEYVAAQTKANKAKIHLVWVNQNTINKISSDKKSADKILCHGTRNAAEQKMFQKHFSNAEILGTEISDTAKSFPMTVEHDFQEPLENWIGNCDIVYSNSFDHAMEPIKTLETWRDQLSADGALYIELALCPANNRARASDPLELDSAEEFVSMCASVGLKAAKLFDTSSDSKTGAATSTVYKAVK